MTDTQPNHRTSLLRTFHESAGAHYRTWQNQQLVAYYEHSKEKEALQARRLALCDLSPLERCGFKGPETAEWLKLHGHVLPGQPNCSVIDEACGLVAKLSFEEHLVLRDPFVDSDLPTIYSAVVEPERRVYALPRQDSHAWLYLCGELSADLMSYLCAVDLRDEPFGNLTVAQTTVAKLNAIVIRHDAGAVPGFHLLCDQPSVAYWWEVLLDTMSQLEGGPVGLDALLALKATKTV